MSEALEKDIRTPVIEMTERCGHFVRHDSLLHPSRPICYGSTMSSGAYKPRSNLDLPVLALKIKPAGK